MSFNKAGKPELPVFDSPAIGLIQTGFTMRRVVTAAGRSFLAEKNLPVQPATDYRFRKCYSAYDLLLYKLDWHIFTKNENPPKHSYGEEIIEFDIPKKYFYPYSKLRQKLIDPTIDAELPNKIRALKDLDEPPLVLALPQEKQPQYTKKITVGSCIKYPEDNFQFRFIQPQLKQTKDILFTEDNNISILKGLFFQNNALSIPEKPIFTNEFHYVCLHDFTNFNIEFEEGWRPLRFGERNLKAVMTAELDCPIVYPRENCDLRTVKYFKDEFKLNKLNEIFGYTEGEEFGHFYLKASNSFAILERPDYPFTKAAYMLDLPSTLNERAITSFATNAKAESDPNGYREIPGSFEMTRRFVINGKDFEIIDGSEKYHQDLAYTRQVLGHEKHIRISKKYRALQLVLKLSLNKPAFAIRQEKTTLVYYPIINTALDFTYPKHLSINYADIRFNHQSPEAFDNKINNSELRIQQKFKQRKSRFINKCPKHGSYTNKLLHRILCAASFKSSRKYRFSLDVFSLSKIDKNISYICNSNQIKDYQAPRKVNYWGKPEIRRMVVSRKVFSDIEISDRIKSIAVPEVKSFTSDSQIKLSKNHLRILKIIKGRMTKFDRSYHTAYMNSAKRITAIKQSPAIWPGSSKLHALRLNDAIYSNLNYSSDRFSLKNKYTPCNYSEYLPKEITDGFELKLDIHGIPEETILSQKNIVPPPGWMKLTKEFNCRLRLGPHPFGFPDFFFAPPVFTQLVTNSEYSIRDIEAEKATREYDFILTKDKLYLPELSMKAPRRLLHQEITSKNSPKEFYIVDLEEPPLQQDQPKHIDSFEQSWFSDGKWKCTTFFGFDMLQTLRTKKVRIKTRKFSNDAIDIAEEFLSNIKYSGMPNITRFLLRSRRFTTNAKQSAIVQPDLVYKGISNFDCSCAELPKKTYFSNREGFSPLKTEKTWTLPQYFPDTYPSGEMPPTYYARFRNFRFPYVPETDYQNTPRESFTQTADYTNDCACHFQEEFRISQFDFGTTEINNLHNPRYNGDYINQCAARNSFIFDTEELMAGLKRFYLELPPDKLFLKKSDLPKSYQHLISPRFFKAREYHSYKYMMRDQSRAAFKFSQMPERISASYSFYGLKDKSQAELEAANYHWIIMLRHSSNVTANLNYSFEENALQAAAITPVYEFSDFEREALYENTYKPQASIDDIHKPAEFKPFTGFGIIEKPMHQLDELYTDHKNLVYRMIKLDTLRGFRHLDYKPVKNLSFTESAMSQSKQQIMEPDCEITNIIKGRTDAAALDIQGRNATLDFQDKSYLRTDYRPLYLPDFIDMETPGRATDVLAMGEEYKEIMNEPAAVNESANADYE